MRFKIPFPEVGIEWNLKVIMPNKPSQKFGQSGSNNNKEFWGPNKRN